MHARWLGFALFACTAPAPGSPYTPIGAGKWTYEGQLCAPREPIRPLRMSADCRPENAGIPAGTGVSGNPSAADREFDALLLDAGIMAFHPVANHALGLAPDFPRTTRWSGTVGAFPTMRYESEVIGRRSLTVPAGTYTTVVVRTAIDGLAYVILNEYACGVGRVRSYAHDPAGNGWHARLTTVRIEDPEAGRLCQADDLSHIPEYREADLPRCEDDASRPTDPEPHPR